MEPTLTSKRQAKRHKSVDFRGLASPRDLRTQSIHLLHISLYVSLFVCMLLFLCLFVCFTYISLFGVLFVCVAYGGWSILLLPRGKQKDINK